MRMKTEGTETTDGKSKKTVVKLSRPWREGNQQQSEGSQQQSE